jgi:Protein of unknown function (DUF2950)
MGMRENRLCAILAAFLWLEIAQGAPLQAASAPVAPAETPAPQRSFVSSEDAVNAFITALRDNREADLRAILGPEADRVIDSGDKHADRELHARFLTLYDQKHSIKQAGPGQAELDAGPWSGRCGRRGRSGKARRDRRHPTGRKRTAFGLADLGKGMFIVQLVGINSRGRHFTR